MKIIKIYKKKKIKIMIFQLTEAHLHHDTTIL